MVHLLDLPVELQINIIQWLPRPGLLAVCMAQSGLRLVAQAILHSNICFMWTQEWDKDGPQEHCPPIMRLLRTLLERPGLAREIRILDLRGDTWWSSHHSSQPAARQLSRWSRLPRDKLSAAVKSTGIAPDIATAWMGEIWWGNSDAVVSLIVALSPLITRISLSRNWGMDYSFLGLVFKAALCNPGQDSILGGGLPKFDNLTSVSLAADFFESYDLDVPEEDDLLALFYLPRIENLSIPIANRSNMSWPSKSMPPPNPSSLFSLAVLRVRENCLGPVLSVCENLTTFSYDWLYHGCMDTPLNDHVLDAGRIAALLVTHCRHTLVQLRLALSGCHCKALDNQHERPSLKVIGSLTALTECPNLVRMTLPIPLVLGEVDNPIPDWFRSIAPTGLEYLNLRADMCGRREFAWENQDVLTRLRNELNKGVWAYSESLKGIRVELHSLRYGADPVMNIQMKDAAPVLKKLFDEFKVEIDQCDASLYVEVRPSTM